MRRVKESKKDQAQTRRFFFIGAAGVLILLLLIFSHTIIGGVTQAVEMTQENILNRTSNGGLKLSYVYVEGREQTPKELLLQTMGVTNGSPILSFNAAETAKKLQDLSWIKHATVERRLPDTIYVTIEERTPIGLWQRNRELSLVDENGHVLPADDLSPWGKLPILIGSDAPQEAPEILAEISQYPLLTTRLKALTRVGERRWDMRFENDVDVRLPEGDVGSYIAKLNQMQVQENVLDRDILVIDLRVPGRVIVEAREPQKTLPSAANQKI